MGAALIDLRGGQGGWHNERCDAFAIAVVCLPFPAPFSRSADVGSLDRKRGEREREREV